MHAHAFDTHVCYTHTLTLAFFLRSLVTPTSPTDRLSLNSPPPLDISWLPRSAAMTTGGKPWAWVIIICPGLGRTLQGGGGGE